MKVAVKAERSSTMSSALNPIVAALRSESIRPVLPARGDHTQAVPFVTISREAGANGHELAATLAQRLNESLGPDGRQWYSFDRELVEQIANEHDIAPSIIESLEDHPHSWLDDMMRDFVVGEGKSSEFTLYKQVSRAVLALARLGHTIIVGRGGVFITRNIPGGVHVLVVAPLEHRVRRLAEQRQIDEAAASKLVREIDRNRADFYRRYWPNQVHGSASFHLTLNSAKMNEQQMVDTILPLIPRA
jgi:cytidylate kinase